MAGTVVAGVDGYRGGWVVALLDEAGSVEARAARSFAEVVELEASVIGVDIPIGIPEEGRRPADLAARAFVGGGRASSVFPTPPRGALEAATFADAVEAARAVAGGKGISQQAFALRGRILEVDAFAAADERIVEVHPEASFRELAGRPLAYSKHTPEGLLERRALLGAEEIELPTVAGVPEVDVLDALAAAWTARRYARGEAAPLPESHSARIGAIWR